MELKDQLAALQAELKTHFEKAAEQQKAQGTMSEELKAQIAKVQAQCDAIDVKLAEKHVASQPEETVSDFLQKHEGLQKLMKDKSGNCVIQFDAKQARQLERKTLIDSAAVGAQTTGVLPIERTPGIVTEARQFLTIRNVLASRTTTNQVLDFVKVNSALTTASPQQGDGHTKKENAVTFTSASEKVKTIATWIPASRQILDDFAELDGFLRSSLPYYVDLMEEQQLLTGSGSAVDLNGLITQGTAFSTALLPLSGSYNRIDYIGRAIQQVTAAKELQPTFIVVHPNDWWSIRLTKDTQGRYILGDPMGPVTQQQLFGLTPVVTTSITSGTFLVGSGSPAACEIRDRMGMTVEIATQHEDYFARNLVAIRAEKRLALVVYRAASFIQGTFTTSP
jgi:HK97 family phage major capsid protein